MAITPTLTDDFALKLSDMATSPTFTEIDGLRSFSGPSRSREIQEIRHHGSSTIIKKPGKLDPGSCQLQLVYDSGDTQQAALQTALTNKTLLDFQAVYTDDGAETQAFSAYVTKFESAGVDPDGFNLRDVELVLDGDVTFS